MWLINTTSLELNEFIDAEHAPPYGILSHCWGDEEMTFKGFRKKRNCSGAGYQKIVDFCTFARKIPYEQESWDNRARSFSGEDFQGIQWVWVDTVCIDKRSSAELSEAINSMYHWYSHAQICLAHLPDVVMAEDETFEKILSIEDVEHQLRRSRWFTRGWTLQELIAPSQVVFVDRTLQVIGTKNRLFVDANRLRGLGPLTIPLSSITGIPEEVLSGVTKNYLALYSVAKRMSWAANRYTTRVEDMAYCLLGIFDIDMPLLYGEGRNAFHRLQEEIVERGKSNSIFAWKPRSNVRPGELQGSEILARSPAAFAGCGNVVDVGGSLGSTLSRKGLGWQLTIPENFGPTVFRHEDSTHYIVRLQCCKENTLGHVEPCIIMLEVADCGHVRRAFDARIFFEEDVLEPQRYSPLENPQTFYIHGSTQSALQCFGSHTAHVDGRVVRTEGGTARDGNRAILAKYRDPILNSRKAQTHTTAE